MNASPATENQPFVDRQDPCRLLIDPLLVDTRQAAQILRFSVSTLEKWRFYDTPGSPPVVRIGRACRYRLSDLREWAASQGRATA